MNEIWVLAVKKSWSETDAEQISEYTKMFAYDSFEKARDTLRAELKKLAFSRNPMFDGNGHVTAMKEYMDRIKSYERDDEEYMYEGWVNGKEANLLVELFHDVFAGKDKQPALEPGFYEDTMIEVDMQQDGISLYAAPEGPINGYMPAMHTNMFSMVEQKDYYLYLNDLFGQDEYNELYIDLKKVSVL